VIVDVSVRLVRGAVRDVVRARATQSFISDVSGGTGVAVAGGAVRSGGKGAGGNGKSVEIEEQSPKKARGGIRNKQLRLTDGFL
jgi:hypothetical protein